MTLFIWWIRTDKTFSASYFHCYVLLFHNVQSANTEFLLMRAIRVLNRSNKRANVCYRKSTQNEENSAYYCWDTYQEILAAKFKMLHGGLLELEILGIFTTVFLLKTIIWTWIFFNYCRKMLWKKDTSHLKIAWHSKRQKKIIEKRERKIKMR